MEYNLSKKEEITPDTAQEIGMETMKRRLNGEYKFVLATHIDTKCVHNHMVINPVNRKNGKSFSTEHDRKYNSAWKNLQKISDEICKENNLSTITEVRNGVHKSSSN